MKKLFYLFLVVLTIVSCDENDASSPEASLGGTATNGSLTRFLIANDQLLVVGDRIIKQYAIDANGSFSLFNELGVGFSLETVFYNGEYVFIGSSSGVYFLEFNPQGNLVLLSTYEHLTACDPVVAMNGLAYSTLRGTGCRFNNGDFLDVIDYSDINNPQVLNSFFTYEPYGLALNEAYLFVCEKGGVSMYERSQNGDLTEIGFLDFQNDTPKDIILRSNHLLVRGDQGIYNMLYDGEGNLTVVSNLLD